jgi:hypothetical protein
MTERTHSRRHADGHGQDGGHGHGGRDRHRHGHHHGHHGHHGHAPQGNQWLKWVVGCVVAFAAVLLFINLTGGGSAQQGDEAPALVAEAEKELAAGKFARAIDVCKKARLKNPDAATLARIDGVQKQSEEQQGRANDKPALELAERSIEAIREMNRLYPAASRERPATREIARLCKTWLDRFRDVAKKYPDTAVMALEVQTLFDSVAPAAMLSLPDDAGDVLFAAERKLTVAAPNYAEILKSIKDYMDSHTKDAKIDELRKRHAAIETAAQAAFDRCEAEARQLAASGRIDEANKKADAMRNAIVNPAMALRARSVEREIDRAAGKK